MANEIQVKTGMSLTNGLLKQSDTSATFKADQTTARMYSSVHDISTSEETITFVDCTPGYIELENLDATNYVNFGHVTANLDGKLQKSGGRALFELETSGVLILQANTATCKVRITALNT